MSKNDPQTFDQAIHEHANQVADLVIGKQHDYGKNNIIKSVIDPKLAIAVRLQDKLARLVNLTSSGDTAHNESLMDTAEDIVGYGLLLSMVIDQTFNLPLDTSKDHVSEK